MPGGESTTLRKLLARSGLDTAIVDFARHQPILGTCAGCILLATDLEDAAGAAALLLAQPGGRAVLVGGGATVITACIWLILLVTTLSLVASGAPARRLPAAQPIAR